MCLSGTFNNQSSYCMKEAWSQSASLAASKPFHNACEWTLAVNDLWEVQSMHTGKNYIQIPKAAIENKFRRNEDLQLQTMEFSDCTKIGSLGIQF